MKAVATALGDLDIDFGRDLGVSRPMFAPISHPKETR